MKSHDSILIVETERGRESESSRRDHGGGLPSLARPTRNCSARAQEERHVYFLRFVGRGKIPPGGQATNERIRSAHSGRGRKGGREGERRVCETLQMSSSPLSTREEGKRGREETRTKGERVFARIFHLLRTCHRLQRSHARTAPTDGRTLTSQMGCAFVRRRSWNVPPSSPRCILFPAANYTSY